jgi:hypothetical protein
MSSEFRMSVRFNSPIPDVREAVAKALHSMGAVTISWSADKLHVMAKMSTGVWSTDHLLSVQIEKFGKIRVLSESGFALFGSDRDANKNTCRQFLTHLANQHKGQTLLRASVAPDAASAELLRAAAPAPTAESELLRGSDDF